MLIHIDDQLIERKLFAIQFEDCGLPIASCGTAAEALRIVRQDLDEVQAIVCDWHLSSAADEACRDELIRAAATQDIPIAVYTGCPERIPPTLRPAVPILQKHLNGPDRSTGLSSWIATVTASLEGAT